ncbi:MAG: CotH kinase family protein, partial [Paludibacteraceae bacterium]|nr:CotH kinase family protein [Paludibacteraceae bacterium]
VFWSDKGTPVCIKSPDEDSITAQQKNYIRTHYCQMESNWKQYLDLNTFLRHFLVGEVSGNTDTYWSVYMYKQRSNDTIYVGPVWDFDLAFDNDNRTYHVNDKADYIYRSGGSTTGYMRSLVDKIVVNDAAAKQQLKDLWAQIRKAGFTEESMLAYIDEQAQILDESQKLNFIRWPILSQYVHQNPRARGSYKAEVDNVRSYMKNRITWMDRKLGFDPKTLDIDEVPGDQVQNDKILRDGQVFIRRNGVLYTLTGQTIGK